jgi:amino acid adenylation domain-containing protein
MRLKLHEMFERAARAHPNRIAVDDPAGARQITYEELSTLTDELASDLRGLGVTEGQRVGIYASKSIPTVAAILASLKAGGTYVPVDKTGPVKRAMEIFEDCGVSLIIGESDGINDLRIVGGFEGRHDEIRSVSRLREYGCDLVPLTREPSEASRMADLAYILYTSGSTGKPKGVMHTHDSARSFVEWCIDAFEPKADDRFSSHAPFHFDLSIFDLFVPLSVGATVVLIREDDGKNPLRLAPLIAQNRISVWYSTPSVLRLLIEHGGLEQQEGASPRLVLFAGEVFSPSHLRRLQAAWPSPRYFNLYGPTETNVCTFYEVAEEVPEDRIEPHPIGKPIRGDYTMVVNAEMAPSNIGVEGELLVRGATVMVGYWNRPDLDTDAFVRIDNDKWYRTGDLVYENQEGNYVFIGRRDRMIKRRGYRVELGEIEATLYAHSNIREVAVVSTSDNAEGLLIHAFVCWGNSVQPSIIALKRYCAENLPLYMVPDRFHFLNELPKTSTDKVDYVRLKSLHE